MKLMSANEAFLFTSNRLLSDEGVIAEPRGIQVREMQSPRILNLNPLDSIITLKHRKVNYCFMAAELIWILSGDEEPWICDHLKAWSNFLDDDGTGNKKLMGAYGPRLRHMFIIDQLQYTIETLKKDKFSRQAIMTISNPALDCMNWKDFPCTQSFQFQIRNNKLNMTVVMRSNDIFKGCTYDWFNFSVIQCIIASILKVDVGEYHHIANNLHMYQTDFDKIKQIPENPEVVESKLPKLTDIKYDSLDEVYYEAGFGKELLKTQLLPKTNGFITQLLKFILNK